MAECDPNRLSGIAVEVDSPHSPLFIVRRHGLHENLREIGRRRIADGRHEDTVVVAWVISVRNPHPVGQRAAAREGDLRRDKPVVGSPGTVGLQIDGGGIDASAAAGMRREGVIGNRERGGVRPRVGVIVGVDHRPTRGQPAAIEPFDKHGHLRLSSNGEHRRYQNNQ